MLVIEQLLSRNSPHSIECAMLIYGENIASKNFEWIYFQIDGHFQRGSHN